MTTTDHSTASLEAFTRWLEREMRPGTVISNPTWWAPRLWRAMQRAWKDTADPTDPSGALWAVLEYGGHREGCPRSTAALKDCTCGWSAARLEAMRSLGRITASTDPLSPSVRPR